MKHVVYTEDVHIQSYANLVLLQRLYTQIESNRWSKVRKQFLEKELDTHKKLTCYYCNNSKLKLKSNKRNEQATVDHIVPKSEGGEAFSASNFVVCCNSCNKKKASKTFDEFINSKYIQKKRINT